MEDRDVCQGGHRFYAAVKGATADSLHVIIFCTSCGVDMHIQKKVTGPFTFDGEEAQRVFETPKPA